MNNIRQTAALFRPVRHVKVTQVAEGVLPSKKRPVIEGIDWDAPEVKAAELTRITARDQADAAQRHLDTIHSHIATAIQAFPGDTRFLVHGHRNAVPQDITRSGAEAAESEKTLHEAHEKHTVSKLPEAARPPARMLFGQLVKHAQFMHGVVVEANKAADAAHTAMFNLRKGG